MIALIIPCFNEALRLPRDEFSTFAALNPSVHLCFVNDGSTDATRDILQELCASHPNCSFINLTRNAGKAEAVRAGMLGLNESLRTDEYTLFGFFDADLATPLEEAFHLRDHLEEAHVMSFGSRILKIGSTISRRAYRHYLGRIIATCISLILHLDVYDTQCGAKLFRRDHIEPLFSRPFLSRWLFDVEIFARIIKLYGEKAEQKIIEVPVKTWIEKGDSRISFTDVLKVPFELLRIKKHY